MALVLEDANMASKLSTNWYETLTSISRRVDCRGRLAFQKGR